MSTETETRGNLETHSWLTAEEYFAQLNLVDRRSVKAVIDFIINLPTVKGGFEKGEAALVGVGTAAIPKSLRSKEPNDIDLKLVIGGVTIFELIDTVFPIQTWEEN